MDNSYRPGAKLMRAIPALRKVIVGLSLAQAGYLCRTGKVKTVWVGGIRHISASELARIALEGTGAPLPDRRGRPRKVQPVATATAPDSGSAA